MASLNYISATTELDAVNQLLAEIGRAPLDDATDLEASTDLEVEMALNTLRETLREVLAEGWRFNTDFGFEVAPHTTMEWEDSSETTTTLNVFLPPEHLLSFKVANAPTQQGCAWPDMVIRKPEVYEGEVEEEEVELIFYDRALNREGLDASKYDFLYIDALWYLDFDEIPEVARKYIIVSAARKFVRRQVGSATLASMSEQDELKALRHLKREESLPDNYNLKQNGLFGFLDYYRNPRGGVYDRRASPGLSPTP